MILEVPISHPMHEWIVEVATQRVTRRLCPDCAAPAVISGEKAFAALGVATL